jgi:hypothetical protein
MSDGFTTLAALVGFVGFGGFVTLAGFVWKLADRLRGLEASAASAGAASSRADALATAAAQDLAAFKIEASRRFVTDEMLTKVEDRIVAAIDRLGDRLDRVIESRTRRAPASREE